MSGSDRIARLCDSLAIDLIADEVQVVDGARLPGIVARHPFGSGQFPFTALRPMLIANVTAPDAMQAAATLLGKLYPDEHSVRVVPSPDGTTVSESTIGSLATRQSAEAIFVPTGDSLRAGADPRAFQRIIARLRDEDGCPWDRKQTHRSLRESVIDEVYEVVDAIDAGDPANLAEELGDLFLLIVMHAQIATEAGAFTIEDVYRGVSTKIVRRHPHVFGEDTIEEPDDLLRIWNAAKDRERVDWPGKGGAKASDGEPHSMPALTRAVRVLKKHPLQELNEDDSVGGELLRLVAAIIADQRDPEALLRDALARHVDQRRTAVHAVDA